MPIRRRHLAAAALLPLVVPNVARAEGESSFARIRRTRQVRIGAVNGQAPYCNRDLPSGQWVGFIPDFGRDLAQAIEAEAVFVESSWGNAVLDLQSNKVDIFFGLNPTPRRALAIDFSHPLFDNMFTLIARPGFAPKSWAAMNDPAVRIAFEIGTSYDQVVTEACPKATLLRVKSNTEATLAVQAGKADCQVLVPLLSLPALKRNPGLGSLVVPTPVLGATTNAGLQREPDRTWRDFVDTWVDWNRGLGRLGRMVIANLAAVGVTEEDIPPQVRF